MNEAEKIASPLDMRPLRKRLKFVLPVIGIAAVLLVVGVGYLANALDSGAIVATVFAISGLGSAGAMATGYTDGQHAKRKF